jgi:hypothetical protein
MFGDNNNGKKVGKVDEIPVDSELIESARKVLDGNWNGKFTIPSATLYPHQWGWYSCFIVCGFLFQHRSAGKQPRR